MPRRRRCEETAKVVRFNWPKYLGAALVLAAASAARASGAPADLLGPLAVAAVLGTWWSAASLAATWWVYDHGAVYRRLAVGLGDVGAWGALHAGFDDATPVLTASIGRPPAAVLRQGLRPGPSLRRARRTHGPVAAREQDVAAIDAGSLDAVFVTFVAHEVRGRAAQRAMFAALRDVLRPGGRLIVTEHRRDLANGVAYGPGALHFRRAATWARRADEAGLTPAGDMALGGLVHRTVWTR